MDSELNSSHGGSTTVGPIASEVEYTLPTFGNSPIAWNSHGQRWGIGLVFQNTVFRTPFLGRFYPFFVKSQFEYTPTFVESSFDAANSSCSRWRINHLILTFQSRSVFFRLARSIVHVYTKDQGLVLLKSPIFDWPKNLIKNRRTPLVWR